MAREKEKDSPEAKEAFSDTQDLNFHRFLINSLPIAVVTVNSEF